MKNLGKKQVLVESFFDGARTRSATETRTVYQDRKGNYFVNWFGGGKRSISLLPDGQFYWRIDVRSIKAISLAEIKQSLQGKIDG